MSTSMKDLGPAPEGWIKGSWMMMHAVLIGIKRALAKDPNSKFLQKSVADQEKLIAGPQEGDLPEDIAALWSMRPMD